jgi:uncharacterized UPF0160 family protein
MFFWEKLKVVTHSSGFHPDDVFAAATLKLALSPRRIDLVRSRDPKVIASADYVFDVGLRYDEATNRFDHHQDGGAGRRQNGVAYAAFGLVWKKFGEKVCGSKQVADLLDQTLVQYIDTMDNGEGEIRPVVGEVLPYTLGSVIFSFLPTWNETNVGIDADFNQAVDFAYGLLTREIASNRDKLALRQAVLEAYQKAPDKRLIVLDRRYPWEDILSDFPEPLYVVEPVQGDEFGHWKVKAVKENGRGFNNRKPLPESWAGKINDELATITGVADATFCHNKRFIAVARSKEGALALARLAMSS